METILEDMDETSPITPMAIGFLPTNLDTYFRYHLTSKQLQNRTFILIAEGKENMDFSNIISMNESSKLLWESLQGKEFTVEDMAQILMENYEIADDTPLPHDVAIKDAEALAQQWKESGIIE